MMQKTLTKDVERHQVDLGVSVLARLGGGHVDDFAGVSLDHHELALSERRTLLGVGQRSARTCVFEIKFFFMIRHGQKVPSKQP